MKAIQRHILLVITLCCASSFLQAQTIYSKSYSINVSGTNEKITTLAKSSNGYLFVGTTNGLFSFNGQDFKPIHFEDSSLQNKAVTAIKEDAKKKTWIGLQSGGIAFIAKKQIRLLKAEEGHPAKAITCITNDDKGNLYFATAGEGIYYYNGKRFFLINEDDGLTDNYVYQLTWMNNELWAGTDRGINSIKVVGGKKIIQTHTTANGLPDNIVKSLFTERKKHDDKTYERLWFGMEDRGIGVYSFLNNEWNNIKNWTLGSVNSILTNGKQLWAATEASGIAIANIDDSLPSVVQSLPFPKFTKARNLLKDAEGNIWFSSNDQLVKTNGSQLQMIIPFAPDYFEQVHAILADSKGNIWINENKGLVKYTYDNRSASWKGTPLPLRVIDERTDITSLYEDNFGHIWIGTMGRGVIIVDPKTGRTRNVTEDNLLIDGSVLSINGKGNDIWISSLGGAVLCRQLPANHDILQPLHFQEYNKVSGIGSNYVYSILVDSKDRVWFATDGKGITMLDKGKFFNYNEKNGIKDLRIYSLCEDRVGNIWFSTSSGGVYRFDGHTFANISVEQGLNDATVTALSLDGNGNIVAITQKGINIINANTLSISYLDENQGVERLNTDLNCIAKKDGNLYFICQRGISRFEADYEELEPAIVLESVKLFLQDVPLDTTQSFSYDENNISFYYNGISFSHPGKIKYQYKLEGLENGWFTTKDNYINFPKLPPGRYTFHVRASLNNQFTNTREAVYSFTIHTPFWWQWWFIAGAISLLIVGVYIYVRQREKQVKRWERLEKEKVQSQFETLKSQVNPHFLFNSFNTLISVIEENPGSAVKYVEHLSDLYRKIVTYRDKDTIILQEELQLINDYFFIQQQRFGNNLQLQINISEEQKNRYMIAPLTLQLLCENAVKHNSICAATLLLIELYIEGEFLFVRNNINPKLTAEKSAGMGLQNIQKRYRLLSRQEIKIEHTAQYFIVQIPLLLA